jgi:uncharacterized protein (DUF924 family)
MGAMKSENDVLTFWRDAGPDKWFGKDDAFDRAIQDNFLATHEAAASGQLQYWERTPDGALALVIALDQFPRNMFRGSARAFAADALARDAADRALAKGFDRKVAPALRAFFYLPLMHSEKINDQERCVALCRTLGNEDNLKYAELHADIIRRFGRFPHRNAVLGRESTPAEQAFLNGGGFAG